MAAPAGPAADRTGGARLTIVLATLNERRSLPELFERIRALPLPPWEAIVVDDGSTDGSREWVRALGATDPRVRLVEHDGRQTTVAAQASGIGLAQGTYVAVMDSDLQHPPELLVPLVRALEDGASVAVASRYVAGGTVGPRSPLRAVLSRGAEGLAKLALPAARAVSDPVSGFFALRRSVFVPLAPGTRGYKLLLFVLVMARGLSVRDVPFRFEPRHDGSSKVTSGFGFVRVFLIELLLARRLAGRLSGRAGGLREPRRAEG
jgi:dolichol-phosphate mannosyltransferase